MLLEIHQTPSPNYYLGRGSYQPEAIVIHIMEGTLAGTTSWFQNKASKVSAHYGIGRDGRVHQYVQETDTAWHAGRVRLPTWSLIRKKNNGTYINPNYYTIGIEHEGYAHSDWTDELYHASSELIRDICQRWQLPIDRDHIIGHREIYAGKKCPGDKVDLQRLIDMARRGESNLPISIAGKSIPPAQYMPNQ